MAVITFSREAHSGTRDLARLLAQRLGYRYVSRDELTHAVGSLTQRSTYQGRDASGRFRVTQVAVRHGDRWTTVGLQYSPIAQPPESAARPSNPEAR